MKRIKHVHTAKCKKYGKWCLVWAAIANNTPLGFLGEHLFWQRIPYVAWLPQVLGIH